MRTFSFLPRAVTALALLVIVAGCASSHLERKTFEGRSLAVAAAYPPEARVRHPLLAASARHRPAGVLRDEQRALQRLEKDLRAAAKDLDVSAHLAGDLAVAARSALGARLVDDPQAADYVLDFRVHDFGLAARSDARVAHFYLEAEALMRDRRKGEVIWSERIRRKSDVKVRLYEGGVPPAVLEEGLKDFLFVASERLVASLREDVEDD